MMIRKVTEKRNCIFGCKKNNHAANSTKSDRATKRLEAAKKLYFDNFANHMTMLRNGEYKKYLRYHITKEMEYEWSLEVKEHLMEEILSGKDLLAVWNLSDVNLPEKEILDAFKVLAASPNSYEIVKTMKKLESLFEPSMYNKIIDVFWEQFTGKQKD